MKNIIEQMRISYIEDMYKDAGIDKHHSPFTAKKTTENALLYC